MCPSLSLLNCFSGENILGAQLGVLVSKRDVASSTLHGPQEPGADWAIYPSLIVLPAASLAVLIYPVH